MDAAPLPMPAFKVRDLLHPVEPLLSSMQQSHEIASRFYSHDLNAYNGIPCWQDGRQGFLDDAVCVFVRSQSLSSQTLTMLDIGRFEYRLELPRPPAVCRWYAVLARWAHWRNPGCSLRRGEFSRLLSNCVDFTRPMSTQQGDRSTLIRLSLTESDAGSMDTRASGKMTSVYS